MSIVVTCCRFKLLLIESEDHLSVREAVLNAMYRNAEPGNHDAGPAAAAGGHRIEAEGNNVPHCKGSLLTTLSDLVTERMENVGETAQRQPDALSKRQEVTAYLSEPVLPVRSPDGKANQEELLKYWYRHKNEWPSLTRLALSYLSCPPSSVTSERVFSLTGNIVTKKRCALLPGNIGRLAFIKFNSKKFID